MFSHNTVSLNWNMTYGQFMKKLTGLVPTFPISGNTWIVFLRTECQAHLEWTQHETTSRWILVYMFWCAKCSSRWVIVCVGHISSLMSFMIIWQDMLIELWNQYLTTKFRISICFDVSKQARKWIQRNQTLWIADIVRIWHIHDTYNWWCGCTHWNTSSPLKFFLVHWKIGWYDHDLGEGTTLDS